MFWIIISSVILIAAGAVLLAGSTTKQAMRAHAEEVARCKANHPAGRGRHGH